MHNPLNYVVLDLETTIKTVHGRTANPFYNSIVAIGTKHNEYPVPLSRYLSDKITIQDVLRVSLRDVDVLVGHNIKFDLLYLWKIEYLQDWLKSGGVIWDTQLAEYYLTNQQVKFSGLRDLAVAYGCDPREKLMEEYWSKGIDTYDIPEDLVCQDVRNDVADTEKIYVKQLIKAQSLGMMWVIRHKMEALLATTEMEYNGFMIDRQKIEENKLVLETRLKNLEDEIQTLIKPYWKI